MLHEKWKWTKFTWNNYKNPRFRNCSELRVSHTRTGNMTEKDCIILSLSSTLKSHQFKTSWKRANEIKNVSVALKGCCNYQKMGCMHAQDRMVYSVSKNLYVISGLPYSWLRTLQQQPIFISLQLLYAIFTQWHILTICYSRIHKMFKTGLMYTPGNGPQFRIINFQTMIFHVNLLISLIFWKFFLNYFINFQVMQSKLSYAYF